MELVPKIDYTNKDFASLRQAMLDLARYRLPEWTDQSPGDLGVLLVDLFAYMGDVILYYQDRIANESFLATATERRSVLQSLRLIGYELMPPVAASADLTLIFKVPPTNAPSVVTIPQGTQFSTKASSGSVQVFEYLGADLSIDLNSAQVIAGAPGKLVYTDTLPVRQSRSYAPQIIGSSTGEPNQAFTLPQGPLILDSLLVEVDEGAGFVAWDRRDSLLYYIGADGRATLSGPNSRDYYVQFDENDGAQVLFGNGVYGRIPPAGLNNIRATFSVGGGSAGNVPAGTITEKPSQIPLLDSVTNALAAAGGADHESVNSAASFGPLAFRSGQRAVTLQDYVALAYQVGGVAKVRAQSQGWNQVNLYIAPQAATCGPVPEDLRKRIIAFFEDRRMVGTFVQVLDPLCVPIDISVDVVFNRHYRQAAVMQAVENSVQNLLAFQNVDFGQPLYLSDVYGVVETTPGVSKATVTRFHRHDSQVSNLVQELQSLKLPDQSQLVSLLQQVLNIDAGGRIDIGDYEIPYLNDLQITIQEATR
jgi:uncharacterized phage protein gp47/JayE